jgi:hypothetical protein
MGNKKHKMVGAPRFELGTSCAQGSCRKSILLVRLALFYVMVHGFEPNLAVLGPKLDLSFAIRQTAGAAQIRHCPLTGAERLPRAYLEAGPYPYSIAK